MPATPLPQTKLPDSRRRTAGRVVAAAASAGILVAATVAPVSAQDAEAPFMCNGLEATIVLTGMMLDEAFVAQPMTLQTPIVGVGTEGEDVIVISQTINWPSNVIVPRITALGGNDTICVRGGQGVFIEAGDGEDTIIVEGDIEPFFYLGVERFAAADVDGGPGNDTIINRTGTFVLANGNTGDDTLHGGSGSDWLAGDEGDDELHGGPGEDRLFGGDGDDLLRGGRGNDHLVGEQGADTFYGGPGNDVMSNAGDSFTRSLSAKSSFIDDAGSRMFGGPGNDTLYGGNRWDRMQGGPGNDIIAGFEGRDYIRGGPGDDVLIGGANIDNVNGNTGNDQIFMQGNDRTSGGYGIDRCGSFSWDITPTPTSCERSFVATKQQIDNSTLR